MVPFETISRAIRKARQSPIRYRVCAIALNEKDEVLGMSHNTTGIHLKRQYHAEERIMAKYRSVKKIFILRIGNSGLLRPIDPCSVCQKMADKRGVKILSVKE